MILKTINIDDLEILLNILDDAYRNDIAIVLTMFELPGHRYGNPNEVETDTRLWEEEKYWIQSFNFWKELAAAVKDHPAIVAYNSDKSNLLLLMHMVSMNLMENLKDGWIK